MLGCLECSTTQYACTGVYVRTLVLLIIVRTKFSEFSDDAI